MAIACCSVREAERICFRHGVEHHVGREGFPSRELRRDVHECEHGGAHVLPNRVRAQEGVELALQLRAVETMWPLGREDVVSSDDWPDVPFDLGGDPDVGTEKQGLDSLQVPSGR